MAKRAAHWRLYQIPFDSLYDVKAATECWEWKGAKDRNGYGIYVDEDDREKAHRLAYMYGLKLCELPDKLEVVQRCGNKLCVNPYHLYSPNFEEVKHMIDGYDD